jgi:CubicO group peptidase (beta-lactamase class C family)
LSDDGLDSVVRWPGEHPVAGWRRADGTKAAVGDMARRLPLASVTKVLTATAVLVATQEGILDLEEAAGPPGSTVRLLLCHASGLPFEGDAPIAPPGQRRIYGNTGYEWLGALVAKRAGVPFAHYVQEGVLDPLRMTATTVSGSPATGAQSTLADLLRFAGELLRPGRILAPETLAEAVTPQLPELDGVLPGFGRQAPNPWGLGFELHGHKAPHWMPPEASPGTFGHFGQSGAFLWVDPEAGVACVALADHGFGPWAIEAWPHLGSSVLAAAR